MGFDQIVLILVATITILSILKESSDKTRNILTGAGISLFILIFRFHASAQVAYETLIKWDVIVLIIFLSVFVDLLDDLGYFEYIGILLVKATRGNQLKLFIAFGILMFFMSAFLDNVTAIILLSSLTITVCKRLEISPVPYITYETFMTGVGALLTPVGSVPNIILNSGAKISFGSWVLTMSFFSIFTFIITSLYFLYYYKKEVEVVLTEDKIEELEFLDPNQVIKKRMDVIIATILILLMVVLFVISSEINVGIELIAAFVAILAMIIFKAESREIWVKIDWNTLFFFAGLFVIVGALDYSKALSPVSNLMADLMVSHPVILLILLIFVGGLASTALNNIPISLLFTSILVEISHSVTIGREFWYSTVIATNIGASLTPIGSVIVIIAFSVLKKSGYNMKLGSYFKATFPLFVIIGITGLFYLQILTFFKLI